MASTPTGKGYWLVASDGGMFAFGSAPFMGSAAKVGVEAAGIVRASSGGGYWIPAETAGSSPLATRPPGSA